MVRFPIRATGINNKSVMIASDMGMMYDSNRA
jgi:predicted metal-binding protein